MNAAAQRHGGFTLLELLVVVVIIGILITFAMLSISNRAVSDRLETEAARLQQLFEVAREDAELQGIELGFIRTDFGYAFLVANEGRWMPIPEGPLRTRPLPPPMTLWLQVDGREVPAVPTSALTAAAAKAAKAGKPKPSSNPGERSSLAPPPGDDDKDDDSKDEALKPQLLFLSSGESTGAVLDISAPGADVAYRLEVDTLGRIKRSQRDDKR